MTWKTGLLFLALSATVATGGRMASIVLKEAREDRVTEDTCSVVGNRLEVGALRDAYEGLKLGLANNQMGTACVSVIDNGRSFSPDCILPKEKYRTVVCKAEANTGVRAQISIPVEFFFSWSLFISTIVGLILLMSLTILSRMFVGSITSQITVELERRLVPETAPVLTRGLISTVIGFILEATGLNAIVRRRVEGLRRKISEAESAAVHEAALRAKHEAESARSKSYIEKVKQIRHDVRSPLSALFAAKAAIAGSGVHDELLQSSIFSSIRGIEKMLEDLQKIEESETAPQLTVVEVVLEEEIAVLRSKFRSGKDVGIFLEYDPSALSPVTVVLEAFRRVLRNLIENAYDALSKGGEIRVSVASRAGQCRIAVEDNGCGIAPEAIANLFSRGATFNKAGGTGLGLYYARETITAWNGTIDFTPLKVGTRFEVSLPLTQVGVTFVGLPDHPKVWVIDDMPLVATHLSRAGFDVERTAQKPTDAYRLLTDSGSTDASVLLDQDLGDGVLGTDLVLKASVGANVVLCTDGYDQPKTLNLARQRSLRVLPKPLCFLASSGA